MYIKFKEVYGENFQSLEKAKITLENQGIILINGNNKYELNANSNGSGKSSCMEMIVWAIYGKTSSGISDPSNKYSNDGCMVKLVFQIDNQEYTIIRSIKHKTYKTGLHLYKDSEDISARNKTDTDKMIKSDIIPFSQDIFLSTVFLSQGFSNRLSVLQPSGRKERIEILTDTSRQVDIFKDKITAIKNNYTSECNKIDRDISYKQGTFDNINIQIESIINDIKESEKDIREDLKDIDINEISNKISNIENLENNISDEINKLNSNYRLIEQDINKFKYNISNYENNILKYESKISVMNEKNICPTCGQEIKKKDYDLIIKDYNNKIEEYKNYINTDRDRINNLESKKSEINESLEILKSKDSKFNDNLKQLRSILIELSKKKDTSKDKEKLKEYKFELVDIKNSIDELHEQLLKYETKRDVANHCVSLVSKQFRGYLLKNVIDFMNSKLVNYSHMLFSNEEDIINLVVDSSKLDIYLNNMLYDTLSGGEKRKVDLALVLTQRDLAMNIAGSTCNLLVLDEVFDNLDSIAMTCVLDLIESASSEVESMFIISHKHDISIPYDNIITVTKNENRTSTINFSN